MDHADLDYDLTTGARFHPLEIVLSACAMFNHGNIRLPARVDRVLRGFLVTPEMHRVHRSVEDDESNSNFGFSLLALPFRGEITESAINRRQWPDATKVPDTERR